jgi:hypothetical protein
MQVIRDTNAGGRFGAALGSSLNQLAQYKLDHINKQYEDASNQYKQLQERNRYANSLKDVLGEDTAKFFAGLNPEERKHAWGNLEGIINLVNKRKQNNSVSDMLTNHNEQQQFQEEPQQEQVDPYQQLLQAARQQNGPLAQLLGQQEQQQLLQPQQQQRPIKPNLQQEPNKQNIVEGKQPFTPDEAKEIGEAFKSPHEKREDKKLALQEKKLASQENKEKREFGDKYREAAKKAEASVRDYQQLLKDARSGKLRSGNMYQLLKKLGWEDFGRNTTTELAEKAIARLSQNVSGKFGTNARLTNFLEQTFQRSLPTLKNTPLGVQIIAISNMAIEEADIIRNNIRKEVIKKYGLTDDTDDIIDEISAPLIARVDQEAADYSEMLLNNNGSLKGFNDLPPAKYYKNEIIDRKNGESYRSNGNEWIKEQNNRLKQYHRK